MSESHRFIPIADEALHRLRPVLLDETLAPPAGRLLDARGRGLRDLRISVIDQCNMRCGYCMPREIFDKDYVYLSRNELLSFEEIARLTTSFVALGVQKVRITGGEPLLRKGLEDLIAMLAGLRTLEGAPLELALTTNGLLLGQKASQLARAGLHRVTVSLDALNPDVFKQMADVADAGPEDVIAGIEAAHAAGLKVKANMVVQRGVNEAEILPMAARFRTLGATLRFIEFMDVGSSNGWKLDQVVPAKDIIELIDTHFPLERLGRGTPSEVSDRWQYRDGSGEIGVISSVSAPFCGQCSRARISAEGGLYTCLFASQGSDLRGLVREEDNDERLLKAIAQIWARRTDRYSELRAGMKKGPTGPRVEMSYIGG